jgi:hypothetical protein
VGDVAGAMYAPYELLLVGELDVGECCVFLWNVKSAPSSAARARRAPCLVVCERGVSVCLVLCVCVCFEVGVSVCWLGMGTPRVCGNMVYGHDQWPIDTSEHAVYVVSGGCPSAAWIARLSARSLPRECLCSLILPRWVRMLEAQRVLMVCVMERSVSRCVLWRYAYGLFK